MTSSSRSPRHAERLKRRCCRASTSLAADACEVTSLQRADLRSAEVVVAATGDDEDNLVVSWLSKQEFAVPRVISRVNNSRNEWLFNELGRRRLVSTPSLLTALVDEAVDRRLARPADGPRPLGRVKLVEVTLTSDSPPVTQGLTLDDLACPTRQRRLGRARRPSDGADATTMRFQEHDHVILMAREDATQDCAAAFIG